MAEGGNAHFLPTQEYDRGTEENKTDDKHEQSLGLTKSRRRYCNTTCMCGLSLAWVNSENSTSNSNADILSRSSSLWLDPLFSATVSGVRCQLVAEGGNAHFLPTQEYDRGTEENKTDDKTRTKLGVNQEQSPTASQLLFPANSYSHPLTTSGYGEISGPIILCLVSRQNRQRNRLFGGPPI